jgi:hypothetical protein
MYYLNIPVGDAARMHVRQRAKQSSHASTRCVFFDAPRGLFLLRGFSRCGSGSVCSFWVLLLEPLPLLPGAVLSHPFVEVVAGTGFSHKPERGRGFKQAEEAQHVQVALTNADKTQIKRSRTNADKDKHPAPPGTGFDSISNIKRL